LPNRFPHALAVQEGRGAGEEKGEAVEEGEALPEAGASVIEAVTDVVPITISIRTPTPG
jgi:hypothetical protein